ncbi:MAG TPA: hypothetical protein VMW95_09540 [Desulfobacterales bacterium]|nr:hypothetical protein [Desulfobacterales bacterium]
MKNKSKNIALEGTRSGDVVGGLLSWTGENLQALLFFPERGLNIGKGIKRSGLSR